MLQILSKYWDDRLSGGVGVWKVERVVGLKSCERSPSITCEAIATNATEFMSHVSLLKLHLN
jgi:hypothetical protein